MPRFTRWLLPLLVVGLSVGLAGCDDDDDDVEATQTIAELAVNTPQLSTLTTALAEAGLVETFDDSGPYTVFAPTNDAFAALPDGALDDLLADEAALTNVLTYHVVAGRLEAADLSDGQMLETLSGEQLTVDLVGDAVQVGGATVVTANVGATNGVVHLIDAVLLP